MDETRTKRSLVIRLFLLSVIAVAALIGAFTVSVPLVGGAFEGEPETWRSDLSPAAKKLVDAAYAPYAPGDLVDIHTHIVGLGAGDTGAKINDEMVTWLSPIKRAKLEIYISAAGVQGLENADSQYVDRLIKVATHVPIPAEHYILGFDANHTSEGEADMDATEFFVPNSYVFKLGADHPELFTPVISVHPYRRDAVQQLENLHKQGARFIKWLPNAQGIDPADPRIDPYYETVRRLGYTIITHAGEEQAVDAADAQKLGNPLKLRRGLDAGVKFIVAHCASLGEMEDYDDPAGGTKSAFELFLRMMDNPKYHDLLYADISAIAQFNRVGTPLLTILKRSDLHSRLVNGSDYPLPAINALIHLGPIEEEGLITSEQSKALSEIYSKNPLLFDFVLKRTLVHPDTNRGFDESVFRMPIGLEGSK